MLLLLGVGVVLPSWALGPPPPSCLVALERSFDHPVLVTVLSPKMVYSMTEWPRMRAMAETEGFDVVAWRSHALSEREWEGATTRARWRASDIDGVSAGPVACAAWLGSPNHFPYSLVIERGRAHPWPIWGVLPDAAWVESLRFRRRALASADEGGGP